MRPLHIGINALYLIPGGVGGTEIYLRSLAEALASLDTPHRFTVFTNRETGATLPLPCQVLPVKARIRPLRILCEQTLLPARLLDAGIDVLLNPGFTAPLLCPCPQVTVFHDLQHIRHPEYFRWWDLPFWRLFLAASARISTSLIAVSDATADDLRRCYGARNIDVVPHGVDPKFFDLAGPRDPNARTILCVSTSHPHKNLDALIDAFSRLSGWRLVIAGLRGHAASQIDQRARGLDVTVTGWIPREELYKLYATATAFIYPSRFEGFGMPILEALAAGLPTACCDVSPQREVAGGAALLFHPDDIYPALEALTTDEPLRARLAKAGPPQAAKFTWRHSAQQTLASLTRAAS